MSLSGTISEM